MTKGEARCDVSERNFGLGGAGEGIGGGVFGAGDDHWGVVGDILVAGEAVDDAAALGGSGGLGG